MFTTGAGGRRKEAICTLLRVDYKKFVSKQLSGQAAKEVFQKDRPQEARRISSGASGRLSQRSGGNIRLLQGRRIESAKKNELYEEKKSVTYKEQDARKVAEYLYKIKDIPPDTIAYIDETGIDRYIYRQRA